MPLELKVDHGILLRPFDLNVWIGGFCLNFAFALILFVADWIYNGSATWWREVEVIIRCICKQAMASIPKARSYNMIFSLTAIWGYYFLMAVFYTGW